VKLRRTPPPADVAIDELSVDGASELSVDGPGELSVDGRGERRRIVLSAGSLIVSNIAVAGLAVATVHISAQHLGGKEFGHFTTVTSFVGMLGLLVDLGVTSVTARDVAKDVPRAGDIIGQALTFRLTLCVVVAPILAGAAFLLYPTERGSVGLGVALMTVDLFFVSMQAVVQAYYSGLVRNQVPALLLLIAKVLYFAGVLIVARETHGSIIPFIIAYLAADGIISVVSVGCVRRRIKIRLHWSPRGWWDLAVVAVPLGAMQVVNRLYSRLDSVLLSLLRGPVDVGQYGIAFNFTDVLSNLPAFVMASVLPSMVRARDREDLRVKLQAVFDVIVWVAAPIAVGGYELRDQIVALVAGPGYGGAAAPMAILILSVVMSFPQVVFVWGCLAISEYRLLLPAVVLTTVTNLGLNLALIPSYGPSGAAWAQFGTESLSLVLTYEIFRRKSRLSIRLSGCGRTALGAAVLIPLSWSLRPLWRTGWTLGDPFIGTALLGLGFLLISLLLGAVPAPALEMAGATRPGRILVTINGFGPGLVNGARHQIGHGRR
jgi:O-antigen/teichoic acid export membrane protein